MRTTLATAAMLTEPSALHTKEERRNPRINSIERLAKGIRGAPSVLALGESDHPPIGAGASSRLDPGSYPLR